MRVGFIGLGKLGLPVALATASRGHEVLGWDADPEVRAAIDANRISPAAEEAVQQLMREFTVSLRRPEEIAAEADIAFVAVQTPHDPELAGSSPMPTYRQDFDYSFLRAAVESMAQGARDREAPLTVAVNSTVLPGTMEREVFPRLTGRARLAYNPFFTAMGTTVRDFLEPEFVLVGVDHAAIGEQLEAFYGTLHDRPVLRTDVKTAELIKVAYNTFIGQKIVFANTMMEICHRTGANVDDLTYALGMATERVVSPRYLRGGMGDGGPCHPRDNIALSWLAGALGLSHDIFDDVMRARERQTEWLADLIAERADGLPVVILGKAFKPESTLTEGSPALLLASILERRGVAFTQRDERVDGNGSPRTADGPGLFFLATPHPEYTGASFPHGSVVLDPWGRVSDQEGVTVVRIGRP